MADVPSTRFAVFLRGINVGKVRVPMAQLRALATGLGASDPKTWLNSGNLAVDWPGDADSLGNALEPALTKSFGYEAHVIVRRLDDLAALVEACPFPPDDDFHAYAVLFPSATDASAYAAAAPGPTPDGEQIERGPAPVDDVIFWRCPKGHTTDSAFGNAQGRGAVTARPTSRNIRTIAKMVGWPPASSLSFLPPDIS